MPDPLRTMASLILPQKRVCAPSRHLVFPSFVLPAIVPFVLQVAVLFTTGAPSAFCSATLALPASQALA